MEETPYDSTIAEKAYLKTKEKGGDLHQVFARILENRKRPKEKDKIEKELLAKLALTAPSIENTNFCRAYRKKKWEETITEEDQLLYGELLIEAEEINYERLKILIELADLKQIAIQTLVRMEEVRIPAYLYEKEDWE